jgi:hypothetical protein
MRSGMHLGLLEALLFSRTRFLFAPGLDVVGRSIVSTGPAQQPEGTG